MMYASLDAHLRTLLDTMAAETLPRRMVGLDVPAVANQLELAARMRFWDHHGDEERESYRAEIISIAAEARSIHASRTALTHARAGRFDDSDGPFLERVRDVEKVFTLSDVESATARCDALFNRASKMAQSMLDLARREMNHRARPPSPSKHS